MNRETFLALLTRKLSDGLSPDEQQLFDNEIASNSEHKELEQELSDYFRYKHHSAGGSQAALKHTWEQIEKAEKSNRPVLLLHRLSKVAAILAIVVSVGLLVRNYYFSEPALQFAEITADQDKMYTTLDDGTIVWLNKHASIRYNQDFGKSERQITLDGEAFFDVAENKSIPLIIRAGNINIKVKGTAFNVRTSKQNDNIEVALIRGSVEVSSNLDKNKTVLLKPNQKLIVPLFKVVPLVGKEGVSFPETKWTQDSLVFKKQKLKDLILQLEKKYEVKIEIRNEKLMNKRFSGIFTDEALKDALEALKLSYPFTYSIAGKAVVIE